MEEDKILTTSTRIANIVSETRSKEFAAEAKAVADHRIKSLTKKIPSITLLSASLPFSDLEKFGITDNLRQLARGFTVNTFRNFPIHVNRRNLNFSFKFSGSGKS
ncbi:uncharacterized protein LOC124942933 [Impatiens glandulifera]|uniref:uncharacterized protein LOC124942933 n=1 Tax=Impatiens glandulifera TaxID=253017 RepID=UPI001FB1935A|nr:uncharacterized protein LOC124942933 [Impatiens glandulifera]